MSHPILPNVMGLVRGLPGVFFCQTGVVLTKFQPFRGLSAGFSGCFLSNASGFDKIPAVRGLPAGLQERFLSNGSGFDKIPTVSGLVRGLFPAFFVKREWF